MYLPSTEDFNYMSVAKFPVQIIDGIHNHTSYGGYQEDVLSDPHKLVVGRRRSQSPCHCRRQFIVNDLARQRLAHCPLTGAHGDAAVVPFLKTRRAAALPLKIVGIVVVNDGAVILDKMQAALLGFA